MPSIEICSPHFLHFIRARFPATFSSGTLNFAEQAEQLTNMVMAGSQYLLPAQEVPRSTCCRKGIGRFARSPPVAPLPTAMGELLTYFNPNLDLDPIAAATRGHIDPRYLTQIDPLHLRK